MFNSQSWHMNRRENERILQKKWLELKRTIEHRERRATKFSEDSTPDTTEQPVRLEHLKAQLRVLTNAARQMGYHVTASGLSPRKRDTMALPYADFDSESDCSIAEQEEDIDIPITPLSKRTPIFPCFASLSQRIRRIQASRCNKDPGASTMRLLCEYEDASQRMRDRIMRRHKSAPITRIYHINPAHSARDDCYLRTEETPLSQHLGTYIEHHCVDTIDAALATYVHGDVFELSEGMHFVSGQRRIYGAVTIRGSVAAQNKQCVIQSSGTNGDPFLWCIGKAARVLFENVTIRSSGFHGGIIRASMSAQVMARRVHFECAAREGINLEHESKLWLDSCELAGAVGAGIHLNTGCKCVLTRTTIAQCGQGDAAIPAGQGGIVIYGMDIDYAHHLLNKTPPLRFPSRGNVPNMVLDPDPTLASMFRGRTYLYIDECKIRRNNGFGISFEITTALRALPVATIAAMMGVSVTVRETRFTENRLGNMGKIPSQWIKHQTSQSVKLMLQIEAINHTLILAERPRADPSIHPTTGASQSPSTETTARCRIDQLQSIAPSLKRRLQFPQTLPTVSLPRLSPAPNRQRRAGRRRASLSDIAEQPAEDSSSTGDHRVVAPQVPLRLAVTGGLAPNVNGAVIALSDQMSPMTPMTPITPATPGTCDEGGNGKQQRRRLKRRRKDRSESADVTDEQEESVTTTGENKENMGGAQELRPAKRQKCHDAKD